MFPNGGEKSRRKKRKGPEENTGEENEGKLQEMAPEKLKQTAEHTQSKDGENTHSWQKFSKRTLAKSDNRISYVRYKIGKFA